MTGVDAVNERVVECHCFFELHRAYCQTHSIGVNGVPEVLSRHTLPGAFVQQEERGETGSPRLEDAGDVREVVLDVCRNHVREDGCREREVKVRIRVGEHVLARLNAASTVVRLAPYV